MNVCVCMWRCRRTYQATVCEAMTAVLQLYFKLFDRLRPKGIRIRFVHRLSSPGNIKRIHSWTLGGDRGQWRGWGRPWIGWAGDCRLCGCHGTILGGARFSQLVGLLPVNACHLSCVYGMTARMGEYMLLLLLLLLAGDPLKWLRKCILGAANCGCLKVRGSSGSKRVVASGAAHCSRCCHCSPRSMCTAGSTPRVRHRLESWINQHREINKMVIILKY